MATYYTDQAASGFNSNPPADDGSQTAANEILWATILAKQGTPLKNYADAIDAELGNMSDRMFLNGSVSKSVDYTVLAADLGKVILASNGITVTLPVAATAGDGFIVAVKNTGTTNVTVDGDTAETIDGVLTKTLRPQGFAIYRCDASNWASSGGDGPLASGYRFGLGLTNGTDADHDINVAAGKVRDAADAADIVLAAIVKQIDATWAAGTAAGGLSSSLSAPANDTLYFVHAIVVGGVSDVGFDTSATAANLVTDHSATAYRPIGTVLTDGSANILAFSQAGSFFQYTVPQQDVNAANPGTATNTVALSVPTGRRVLAHIQVRLTDLSAAADAEMRVGSVGQTLTNRVMARSDFSGGQSVAMPAFAVVMTDTSGQVDYALSLSNADITAEIFTVGWEEIEW